eukprot:2647456-Prymnesium_polylepis.2
MEADEAATTVAWPRLPLVLSIENNQKNDMGAAHGAKRAHTAAVTATCLTAACLTRRMPLHPLTSP